MSKAAKRFTKTKTDHWPLALVGYSSLLILIKAISVEE